MSRRRGRSSLLFTVLFWSVAAVILFYVLFPFYWAVKTSLTSPGDLPRTALYAFPDRPTVRNYIAVFQGQPFGRNLLNSLVVAVATVLLSLTFSALAAYALGKFRFRGKKTLLYVILAVSVFPQIAVLPGLYTIIRGLGLYNTWGSLVLSYLIFTLPFTVWTLTTFVKQIPDELEEAAVMDGASALETLERFGREFLGLLTAPTTIALYRLVIGEAHRLPELGRELDAQGRGTVWSALKGWMTEAASRGALPVADVEGAAGTFIVLLMGDLPTRLMLGAVPTPSAPEIERRAARALEGFTRLWVAPAGASA